MDKEELEELGFVKYKSINTICTYRFSDELCIWFCVGDSNIFLETKENDVELKNVNTIEKVKQLIELLK